MVTAAVKDTVNVAVKIETILKAEEPLEKPFVSALSTVMGDVEARIAAAEAAITSTGLNFPADSQVYKEFVTLIADFKELTPVVERAVNILEGNEIARRPARSRNPGASSGVSRLAQSLRDRSHLE